MAGEFRDRLQDLLDRAPDSAPGGVTIECRHFFSGAAAYADRRIFASLTPAGMALKLPEDACRELVAQGATALRYFPKAPVKKNYVVMPEAIAGEAAKLAPWIGRSIAYVLTLPEPAKKVSRRRAAPN